MKSILKIALVAAGVFTFAQGNAKPIGRDTTIGHKIGHTAKKVGHKTSEIAAKGAATVTDKKYDDKYGPNGEAVYIDKHSRYFYVNKLGHRVYVKKSHLRNSRPDKD